MEEKVKNMLAETVQLSDPADCFPRHLFRRHQESTTAHRSHLLQCLKRLAVEIPRTLVEELTDAANDNFTLQHLDQITDSSIAETAHSVALRGIEAVKGKAPERRMEDWVGSKQDQRS